MNAVAKVSQPAIAVVSDDDVIRVLQNSLYPGAKDESVRLVLAWCKATGRDPMKKPVHLVPMNVKVSHGNWEWRDVIMPGISTYRTDAARTGEYAGKTEPEFGPDETHTFGTGQQSIQVTYPKWCKITVQRLVGGGVRHFTAKEYWIENYASAGKDTDAPNSMWKKRPYGQLGKCTEAQALRMAFPEETGNTNAAEEMEGKAFEGTTLEAEREPQRLAQPQPGKAQQVSEAIAIVDRPKDKIDQDDIPDFTEPLSPVDKLAVAADRLVVKIEACETEDDLHTIAKDGAIQAWRTKLAQQRPELDTRIADAMGRRYDALTALHLDGAEADPFEELPPLKEHDSEAGRR